jgi:hypothetical protein
MMVAPARRKKMSPMSAATGQFVTQSAQISNLDRCSLCGRPRSVHGIDWTCSAPPRRRVAAVVTVLAGLLALAGIGFVTATTQTTLTAGTVAWAVLLAGLTVLGCAVALLGRPR